MGDQQLCGVSWRRRSGQPRRPSFEGADPLRPCLSVSAPKLAWTSTQRALFAAALDIIERQALDLVNRALELFLLADGTLEYSIYELPAPGTAGIAGVYRARTSFQLMISIRSPTAPSETSRHPAHCARGIFE
ncbi:hypothetical protein ABL841_30130 [Variovorax paradoxus]|uniref:hypothetical protein n=1 Tax=Variovorax paradoxus TaxID=34073 RepID=UPI003AAA2E2A